MSWQNRRIHLIGAGGIGMSALALALLDLGICVTGSDLRQSKTTDLIARCGGWVTVGHAAQQVEGADLVVYSSDIPDENPELQRARALRLPLLHRSELLAQIVDGQQVIQVTGSHGKTTTTSLLAHAMERLGWAPSFLIGGIPASLGRHGAWGKGRWAAVEGDESDGSFLRVPSEGAIFTNLEPEHLNYWKEFSSLCAAGRQFMEQVRRRNWLFWCGDDPVLAAYAPGGVSYGFGPQCACRIANYRQEGPLLSFDLAWGGDSWKGIQLPLAGAHNALNGAAVFALLTLLGAQETPLRAAFQSFAGVGRRLEKKGEVNQIAVYDDYGHHPTEIQATLAALKSSLPADRRLVVAWQPHRYTRTQDCWELFRTAFQRADRLIWTEIYGAGEQAIPGIVSDAIPLEVHSKRYVSRGELVAALVQELIPGDVLVTLGAGDITEVGPAVLQGIDGTT